MSAVLLIHDDCRQGREGTEDIHGRCSLAIIIIVGLRNVLVQRGKEFVCERFTSYYCLLELLNVPM